MSAYALQEVSNEELQVRIDRAKAIHPLEPCRVGMYLGALEEVMRLRFQLDGFIKAREVAIAGHLKTR